LLTGSSFDTQSFGARFSAGINNLILTTAVSYNGDSAEIRTPFGGDPSFTSLMVSDFNLANQILKRSTMGMLLAQLFCIVDYSKVTKHLDLPLSSRPPNQRESCLRTIDTQP
jgi:hypothetical protein